MRALRCVLSAVLLILIGLQPVLATPTPLLGSGLDHHPQQIDEEIGVFLDLIYQETPTYTENFRRDRGGWLTWENETSAAFYEGGRYHMVQDEPNHYNWVYSGPLVEDFLVEVDATTVAGPQDNFFGLLFRVVEGEGSYLFAIGSSGGYWLNRVIDGEPETLLSGESAAIAGEQGTINRLGVLAQGSTIILLINDQVVDWTVDESFQQGAVGLVTGAYDESGVEIIFDDLTLWDLAEIPDLPPLPDLEEGDRTNDGTDDEPAIDIDAAWIDSVRQQEPTVSDSFNRDRNTWHTGTGESMDVYFQNRAFHIEVLQPNLLAYSDSGMEIEDFLAEVDVSHLSGPLDAEAGLLFRLQGGPNGYLFVINGQNGYRFAKMVDGVQQTMMSGTLAEGAESGENAINRLGVVALAGQIVLLVNDEIVAQLAQEPYFASGDVALAAGTNEEADAHLVFDDFELWDLAELGLVAPTPESTNVPTPEAQTEVEAILAELYTQEPDLVDSFGRDQGAWSLESDDSARRFYQDRALHIEILEPALLNWSSSMITATDFLVEVDVMQEAGMEDANYGLIFRMGDSNYDLFAINSTGAYQLKQWMDDGWIPLIDQTSSEALEIGLGAVNRLGVLARGNQIALLANEQVLAVVEDNALTRGQIAMFAESVGEANVAVVFDDLEMWDLSNWQADEEATATPTPQATAIPEITATPTPTPAPQTRLIVPVWDALNSFVLEVYAEGSGPSPHEYSTITIVMGYEVADNTYGYNDYLWSDEDGEEVVVYEVGDQVAVYADDEWTQSPRQQLIESGDMDIMLDTIDLFMFAPLLDEPQWFQSQGDEMIYGVQAHHFMVDSPDALTTLVDALAQLVGDDLDMEFDPAQDIGYFQADIWVATEGNFIVQAEFGTEVETVEGTRELMWSLLLDRFNEDLAIDLPDLNRLPVDPYEQVGID